jgi:membrane protein involved in colicin uptake
MRELWAQTKAFSLAVGVHVLMAALVVLGTMDWKPFKPPALTGMTIEAVMVDTSVIKQRREEAKREAERAVARKAEQDRRQRELKSGKKICVCRICVKNRNRTAWKSKESNSKNWNSFANNAKKQTGRPKSKRNG